MSAGAPPPPDERVRLAAVQALALLDTPREERFERVTRTARRLLRTPMALITLVDAERQWFKSCQGLGVRETARSASFCAHAIHADQPFVVPDAHADHRFQINPLVTGSPFIRAYLGIPLHGPTGHRVGTLCVLDDQPRQFTPEDVDALADLARWAESELDRTELAQAVASQRASEERLRAVLEAVPESVATFDRDGRILTLNPAGERLYGCAAEEVVGRDVGMLLVDDCAGARDQLFNDLAELRPGDEPLRRELTGRRADGEELPLEVTVGRITVDGGAGYVVAARDLTERRRAEEAVAAMSRRLELILAAAAEGICGLDVGGRVVFANPAARRMFGVADGEDIAGISLHERFHARRPDGSPYPWEDCPSFRTLHEGEPVRVSTEVFFRADGSPFAVEYASAPIVEHGTVTGMVISFTDVTQRREVERMKDEFVAVVSHELRTPLTSIRGSLGLLASGAVGRLSSEAQRMADIAVSNTDRLVRLVNDILDLERIESGQVQLERSSVPVVTLLEEAVAAVAGMARHSDVDVRLSGVDRLVWVDRDWVVQALANLLSNAVKFSPAGQVVEVAATVAGETLELRVTDRGRGIPAGMGNRIFDRFQQVDASDARERGGTGLGLAIVKSIVEQHGGTITVESSPGEGSTFTIAMPCGPVDPAPGRAPLSGSAQPAVRHAGRRVLAVDDEPDLQEVAVLALERLGSYSTTLASSGEEGVRLAREHRPDVILLDVMMPELDGPATLSLLRKDPVTAAIPVVFLTAKTQAAERDRLASMRVAGILAKPFDPITLAAELGELMGWS